MFSFLYTACDIARRIAYIVCTSPPHHQSDYMLLHLMTPSCSLSVFLPTLCTEQSCSEWEKRLEPHPTCTGDWNRERDDIISYSQCVYMAPYKSGNVTVVYVFPSHVIVPRLAPILSFPMLEVLVVTR